MKLQRTTLILLTSALLLGGFVYFYEVQGAPKREVAKTAKQPIFSFKQDQIQSLTIYTSTETLEFERVSKQQTSWRMKAPKDAPASDAAVAFLLNLLVNGKSDRTITVPTTQRQEYGFDRPFATVRVQLKNQQTHRLVLGKPDFNRSFLYAQADPPSETPDQLPVLLVPIDFEYAVNRPISEWQIEQKNPKSPKPSPKAGSAKPSPTTGSTKPSPTTESPKPSPTANTKPSPTAETPKPSPTANTKPSPTAETPKPSPTTNTKPSPTAETPKPSPTTNTKPSPAAESPKPSPTPNSKPSPAAESPKPSPTPNTKP